jgi:hypothetical protein
MSSEGDWQLCPAEERELLSDAVFEHGKFARFDIGDIAMLGIHDRDVE